MRIGYGKIGRVIEINEGKWGESGGDNEPAKLLLDLATRNPDHTWVVIGKNSGWAPPLPNIENPWQEWKKELKGMSKLTSAQSIQRYDDVTIREYDTLDGIVNWLGQHGTSNSPIPKVKDRSEVTRPQESFLHYSSHILRGINRWRMNDPIGREEIYLLADVRNAIKCRDLKWPRRHEVLTQFNYSRQEWCERYGDPRSKSDWDEFNVPTIEQHEGLWRTTDKYVASGLELTGVLDRARNNDEWNERESFGAIINEARNYGMIAEKTRLHAMQHYILPANPAWLHGKWTAASLDKLGTDIQPMPYRRAIEFMQSVKSTITTPSSGSGWATAKPWESFSAGTICFFHPYYDTQGHIIPTLDQLADGSCDNEDDDILHLARWLRVDSPESFLKRVEAINTSRETYEWLRDTQYRLFEREMKRARCINLIEERLGLA